LRRGRIPRVKLPLGAETAKKVVAPRGEWVGKHTCAVCSMPRGQKKISLLVKSQQRLVEIIDQFHAFIQLAHLRFRLPFISSTFAPMKFELRVNVFVLFWKNYIASSYALQTTVHS
jgi:hypothetical protein